jgi:phosphate transport system permease protein
LSTRLLEVWQAVAVESTGRERSGAGVWQRKSRAREWRERIVKGVFGACAYLSVLTTIGIVLVLIFETIGFFREVSIVEFFTDTRWSPAFEPPRYGITVLASATLMATLIALLVAVPIGILAARGWLKPALEILAGVPTVVYGYFALTFLTPFLKSTLFPSIEVFNLLAAGLIMGIMILPTIASISEDAIYAVPRSLREGAYALGATKRETATKVVVPAALSGIVASVVLGLSRAVGETMILVIVSGSLAQYADNPLKSAQAMTAFIVSVASGETERGSPVYLTIFAIGMTLFLMTLVLNLVSYWFVRRFRETY